MTPINVFIDTSALYAFGAAFDRLQYLVSIEVARVFLSHVVVREWASHIDSDLRKSVEAAKSNLHDVIKNPCASYFGKVELLAETSAYLDELLAKTPEISQNKMEGLLAQLQAQIMPLEIGHGSVIIDSYFNGVPPFRSKKSRQDFPDAFILENAKDVIKAAGAPLHCIVADGPLSSALSSIEGIILYPSLKYFVQSDVVNELASNKGQERVWLSIYEKIRGNLSKASEEIESSLESLFLNELPGQKVEHPAIPDDNNEAIISGLYEPTNVSLYWEDIENYGNGIITIPFSCEVKGSIEFYVFRADAYDVPDEVWIDFQDPESHHYFDAGGEVLLAISGTIEVRFEIEEPNEGDLPEITEILINEIEELTIHENYDGKIFV